MTITTPRLYLIRHGETAWSLSGQYTGKTDLPLLPQGEAQVRSSARILFGHGKLIDPVNIARVYVSPRWRAGRTADLFFGEENLFEVRKEGDGKDGEDMDGDGKDGDGEKEVGKEGVKKEVTDELAEWDYGDYEGLLTREIRERRKMEGRDGVREWDIWRDGCVGGESPQQVTTRLDTLIAKIRAIQAPCMRTADPADIVLVAHGHILRAFTKRWLGYPLEFPLSMMLEPGGVGILSYQHQNIEEPAFLLGMGFPVEEER